MTAFPRLAGHGGDEAYTLGDHRTSSCIQATDDMLGDGYWPGASALVAGPTGIGKTLSACPWLAHG